MYSEGTTRCGRTSLDVIHHLLHTGTSRAVRTAIEPIPGLHAMTDDPTAAVVTCWRKVLDCAFKAVKDMPLASGGDFDREVIVIPANFTDSHSLALHPPPGGDHMINDHIIRIVQPCAAGPEFRTNNQRSNRTIIPAGVAIRPDWISLKL